MKKDSYKEVPRTIRLPQELWDELDSDARRCCRSPVKQLEALLKKWFKRADVEIALPKNEQAKTEQERNEDKTDL